MKRLFTPEGEAALLETMQRRPLLAFDFDGTLAPIVARPGDVRVPAPVAHRLQRLCSRLPVVVAHGEGYADFSQRGDPQRVHRAMRYVDSAGRPTETYPANPNGSPEGLTAVTTPDGRFTALMPHAERVFRNVQMSWTSGDVSALSPWMRMFANARRWVG